MLATRIAGESLRRARAAAGIEPRLAELLPELVLGITPEQLAMIAARAMAPKPVPLVGLEHLHAPAVSVREQAALIVDRLRRQQACSFRALIADADATLVVVARFLALLELFREGAVAFDQAAPLGELTVRWTGSDEGDVDVERRVRRRPAASVDAEPRTSRPRTPVIAAATTVDAAMDPTGQDGRRDPVD